MNPVILAAIAAAIANYLIFFQSLVRGQITVSEYGCLAVAVLVTGALAFMAYKRLRNNGS